MNEIKLKPCPFCGAEAEVKLLGSSHRGGYIVARCKVCGAATRSVFYKDTESKVPLEETNGGKQVIKRWNNRTGIM